MARTPDYDERMGKKLYNLPQHLSSKVKVFARAIGKSESFVIRRLIEHADMYVMLPGGSVQLVEPCQEQQSEPVD